MTTRGLPGWGLLAVASALGAACAAQEAPTPGRPVATYSIVARDPLTGQLGLAVQSHWFSVGSVVPWLEAGVGAVATQSFVEPSYGPLGLDAMRRGVDPKTALDRLIERDAHPEVRQVAFVDSRGRVAAHTGAACIPAAGHATGDGYSVQANLMLSDEVPAAMARAFESSAGALAERLLTALEAAEEVGGDIRGKQSAALVVVRAARSERPWTDRLVDLRVEDHHQPLRELRRLLRLHRAFAHMNRGDEAVSAGRMEEAEREYAAAERMFPDNAEFAFWHAFALVTNGRVDDALPVFARAFRLDPVWMMLVPRLVDAGHLPEDPDLAEKILATGPKAKAPR